MDMKPFSADWIPQEDGFCQGEFEIHIIVVSEDGFQVDKYYLLDVKDHYEKTSMKEISGKQIQRPAN